MAQGVHIHQGEQVPNVDQGDKVTMVTRVWIMGRLERFSLL